MQRLVAKIPTSNQQRQHFYPNAIANNKGYY